MKAVPGLFGTMPDKPIKSWDIPISHTISTAIRHRANRVRTPDTKHDSGGYQNLVLDLESRLRYSCSVLEVDYLVLGIMFRHAHNPSGGGWEDLLSSILRAARRHFEGEDPGTTQHDA